MQQNKIQGLKPKIHEHTGTKRSIKPIDIEKNQRYIKEWVIEMIDDVWSLDTRHDIDTI